MATKERVRGAGCIVQLDKGRDGSKPRGKCRRWRLVASVGKDPRTGRYRQRARNFAGTYTQAQRAMGEFIAELMEGAVVARSDWTFEAYARHYVEARVAAGEIQERTARTSLSNLRTLGHLVGALRLQEITPEAIEAAYVDLRAGESPSGRPLSGRTLHNVNLTAFLMFQDAKEKGVIAENPLTKVPVPRNDTREKRALSAEDYAALLEALDPTERMQCAVALCAALGLRRSEAVGLSWGDVDFAAGTVSVSASCKEDGTLKDPKTEAGRRLLPMPSGLAEALRLRKRAVVRQLLREAPDKVVRSEGAGSVEADGATYDVAPDVSVTCDGQGGRMKPKTLSSWWAAHREGLGVPGCTLHGLRHTFLSLAAAQGVHPSVMQRLAGHKDPGVTMRIYTHVTLDSERAAMETMQAAYMRGGQA